MSTNNVPTECQDVTLPHSQGSGITESASIQHPAIGSGDRDQGQNTSKPVVQNDKRLDSPDVEIVSQLQQSFLEHA